MPRKTTLAAIRENLKRQRDAIQHALEGDDSLLKSIASSSGGDVADKAYQSTSGEISSHLLEISHHELAQISQALRKMDDGTYGRCGGCSQSIPTDRLEALPFAIYCIKCQLEAEENESTESYVTDWSLIVDPAEPPQNLNFRIN